VSKFFTVDLRVRYQVSKTVTSAAFGIDNVNNYKFWNFHPYPSAATPPKSRWISEGVNHDQECYQNHS
jgi:iron complex outermembrane receptor protein